MVQTRQTIDISGLDKADILRVLYNNSRPMGLGFLQATEGDLTEQEAQEYINRDVLADNDFGQYGDDELYFDYVRGRPLKINLTGDEFDPWGYDRDNGGDGTAARLIDTLR